MSRLRGFAREAHKIPLPSGTVSPDARPPDDDEDAQGGLARTAGCQRAPTRGQLTASSDALSSPQSPRPSRRPKHSRGRARGRSAFRANTFRHSRIKLQPTAQPGHRLARGGRGSQAPSCGAAGTPDWLEGPTAQLGHQTGPREEGGRGGPGNAALHPTAQPGHRTSARAPTAQPERRTGRGGRGRGRGGAKPHHPTARPGHRTGSVERKRRLFEIPEIILGHFRE